MNKKICFIIDKKTIPECAVCMELINDTDKIILKCGHKFHATCMFSSIMTNNYKCPLCRTIIIEKSNNNVITENINRIQKF